MAVTSASISSPTSSTMLSVAPQPPTRSKTTRSSSFVTTYRRLLLSNELQPTAPMAPRRQSTRSNAITRFFPSRSRHSLIENAKAANETKGLQHAEPLDGPQDAMVATNTTVLTSKPCDTPPPTANVSNIQHAAWTSDHVLQHFASELTEFEKHEIQTFQDIYFFATLDVKSRRRDGKIHDTAAPLSSSPNEKLHNFGYDDERGDYLLLDHDHLAYRYEVLHRLGSGSFGQVVCCFDHLLKRQVAIKLIRNRKKYTDQSLLEVQFLTQFQSISAKKPRQIIEMYDSFTFRSHLCIAFESLGMNLYDFLKLRCFQGLQIPVIRCIAVQLIDALHFLKLHSIIHCDLKPENVLIHAPMPQLPINLTNYAAETAIQSICLIDFGSSCYAHATMYTYIQSRFYRSPEVLLGCPYGVEIDMWSLGCILVELCTGHPLFAGENEQEQLACIMELFGPPPPSFLLKCKRRRQFFDQEELNATTMDPTSFQPLPFVNSRGRKRVVGSKSLESAVQTNDPVFLAFLKRCFVWDPSERMTPEQAKEDPWITGASNLKENEVAAAVPTRQPSIGPTRPVPIKQSSKDQDMTTILPPLTTNQSK